MVGLAERQLRAVELTRSPGLAAVPGVAHGFSDRRGGVSEGALASLNLALRGEERPERVVENWRRALAALAPGLAVERLALLDQVHGAAVAAVARGAGPLSTVAVADAAVTTVPGVVLAVRTAECVPILLAAPGGVAVAHAGWRGTVAGVVGAAVQRLCAATGAAPDAVVASIGPHIGQAAYEVGEEVVDGLCSRGLTRSLVAVEGPRGRPHVDLGAAVAALLRRAGVERVDQVGGCTASSPYLFSHRADGPSTGRLAGLIALVDGP